MTNLNLTTENTESLRRKTNPAKPLNRDHAIARLSIELGRAHNDNSYEFSIALIQFDGLSMASNRLGHASADDELQRALSILAQDLDAQDLCCRLGADEFLLIFPAKNEPECPKLIERLRQSWTPEARARGGAAIEVSVGFASSHAKASTVQGLFAAADESRQPLN
jgi:diguanylate cyclase (GGDEF)-like protein